MPKVYDSWKDGSDVYKDKNGFYIIKYNLKTKSDYKKYLRKTAETVAEFTKREKTSKEIISQEISLKKSSVKKVTTQVSKKKNLCKR